MQGTAGSAPEPSAVAAALQGHQLFVYLGHGGGEQYIGAPCPSRAVSDQNSTTCTEWACKRRQARGHAHSEGCSLSGCKSRLPGTSRLHVMTGCCGTMTPAELQLQSCSCRSPVFILSSCQDPCRCFSNDTAGCAARRALARLPRCAAALLMGCSSGRLRDHGAYDPSGTVLAYLLAGAHPV